MEKHALRAQLNKLLLLMDNVHSVQLDRLQKMEELVFILKLIVDQDKEESLLINVKLVLLIQEFQQMDWDVKCAHWTNLLLLMEHAQTAQKDKKLKIKELAK